MVDSPKVSVLILGASGRLGSLVTKHALKNPKLTVSILVRDLEKSKDLVDEVRNAGGRVIQADYCKPETLNDVTKGIHTVISCLSGPPAMQLEAHCHILNDAARNGVKRFFPSQFGTNHEHASPANQLVSSKKKLNQEIEKANIKPVIITCGVLVEFLLDYNKRGLSYYQNIDQKIDFTTYDDVAKFVIEIAADPEKSGKFNFVGEKLTTRELVETYNKVRGTNIQAKNAGSLDELKNLREQKEREGDQKADYLNFMELIYTGKGQVSQTNNKEFPQVKTTTLEEFFQKNPDAILV